jgi:hypothetical protein
VIVNANQVWKDAKGAHVLVRSVHVNGAYVNVSNCEPDGSQPRSQVQQVRVQRFDGRPGNYKFVKRTVELEPL